MKNGLAAVVLCCSFGAVAAPPVYRCGPGDYSDHCGAYLNSDKSRLPLPMWLERTRGFPCPSQYIRVQGSTGTVYCEVPVGASVVVRPESVTELPK